MAIVSKYRDRLEIGLVFIDLKAGIDHVERQFRVKLEAESPSTVSDSLNRTLGLNAHPIVKEQRRKATEMLRRMVLQHE